MAVTRITPRKTLKNWSAKKSMEKRLKYDQKEEKTQGGVWISEYECDRESAAIEFEMARNLYALKTGRSQPEDRDVLMYGIIQSFKPGEVDPETAHEIGYKLAMRFTKGQHKFVVSTHVDKGHIHSHIEFCAINLDCDRKFRNEKDSYKVLQKISDELCEEYGLSVIENPKENQKTTGEAAAEKYGTSWKEKLRKTIDRVLPESKDYKDFLARMREEGYEIKEGKNLAFRAAEQERFTRSKRLGEEYTQEALQKRLEDLQREPEKQAAHTEQEVQQTEQAEKSECQEKRSQEDQAAPKKRKPVQSSVQRFGRKVNPIIDIQAKLAAGKGGGYERWAKVFNLKEAARTLNFLVEHQLTDYDELTAKVESLKDEFNDSQKKVKALESRMDEVAKLKTHIIRYSKTRDVYRAYKRHGSKPEFRAAHEEEIAQHEAAKRAFDALNGKPIPKVAQLTEEYTGLLEQKKAELVRYKAAKRDMIDYQTALQNIDKILGIEDSELTEKRPVVR